MVGMACRLCKPPALLSFSLPVHLSPSPVCGKRGGRLGLLPQAGEHGGAAMLAAQVPWAGARCLLGWVGTSVLPLPPKSCRPSELWWYLPCNVSTWHPPYTHALPLSAAAAEAG